MISYFLCIMIVAMSEYSYSIFVIKRQLYQYFSLSVSSDYYICIDILFMRQRLGKVYKLEAS